MSSGPIVAVLVIALVVAAGFGVFALRRRQQPDLRRWFGSEYGRTVERHGGDTAAAERELAQRVERHRELTLTPLGDAERERAERAWAAVQARFVDSPAQALAEAGALLGRVARERGYPDSDVDAQIDAISVDHGEEVESYRVLRAAPGRGASAPAASTEEQRVALVRARALFAALIGADRTAGAAGNSRSALSKPRAQVTAAHRTGHVPAQREHHA
ncbi:hypothetical protein [Kitasatospora sp. NPDC088134]|uniref:hypothetical protein n=1 Tax=Kitasatospora sp. NPDC088134 TaxID=3364071 RepID=UPI0037F42B40